MVPEDHGDVQEVVQGDEEVLLSDVQGMQGAFDCQTFAHQCMMQP